MSEKSLQPSKAETKHPYVAWRPRIERDPEFNPFLNVVDGLTGTPLVKGPMIPGASERF